MGHSPLTLTSRPSRMREGPVVTPLNNAHQSGGGGSGEGVNEGGAVGCLAGVVVAEKHTRPQEGKV